MYLFIWLCWVFEGFPQVVVIRLPSIGAQKLWSMRLAAPRHVGS